MTRVYVQVVNKYIIWRISDARAAGEARDAGVMVAHAGQPPLPDGMPPVTAHPLSPPAPKWAEETSPSADWRRPRFKTQFRRKE